MKPSISFIAAVAASFAGTGAIAADAQPQSFSGSAYALGTDSLLFRETHFLYSGPNGGERLVLYACPDGRPFARKWSRDEGNPQAPDFDMTDARMGYREGVRREGEQREVYVQRNAAQPEQSGALQLPADGVIDTGFDVFVQRHWDELVRGDTLKLPFLVPSRRTFFAFKATKVEQPAAPPNSVTFRLASSSWFSFLLPHIDVSYDLTSRRIVRYEGLSNVRDEITGKNYRVHFEYARSAVFHPVAKTEVEAARSVALSASCATADKQVSASGQ